MASSWFLFFSYSSEIRYSGRRTGQSLRLAAYANHTDRNEGDIPPFKEYVLKFQVSWWSSWRQNRLPTARPLYLCADSVYNSVLSLYLSVFQTNFLIQYLKYSSFMHTLLQNLLKHLEMREKLSISLSFTLAGEFPLSLIVMKEISYKWIPCTSFHHCSLLYSLS